MRKIGKSTQLAFLFILVAAFLSACKQTKVKQQEEEPAEAMVGNDKDEHGCLASAGYTWSEVRKDCIRLFESGIRVEAAEGSGAAYIVFSPDSLQAELFFSDDSPQDLLDRRSLPDGGYAWNQEDDDTKNVRFTDGIWTISQRNQVIYQQDKKETDSHLGKMLTRTYEGVLPAADCPGIRYTLIIKNREHSGDGTFSLTQTYLEAEDGKDISFFSSGKRYTLRGTPENADATVWELIPDEEEEKTFFLCDNDSTLTLLGQDLKIPDSGLNYSIKLVK